MSSIRQTSASGKSLVEQFRAKYGGERGGRPKGVNRAFILLIGRPKSGKSTLAGTNPAAIRVDLNRAGPTMGEQAIRIPAYTHDGVSLRLDWKWLADVVQDLERMAEQGEPDRPKTVIIDTLSDLIQIAREAVEKEAGKPWQDLHGKQAWGQVYDRIYRLLLRLTKHYGVVLIGHVVEQSKPLGDDNYRVAEGIDIPDGLWKLLHKEADAIIAVDREDKAIRDTPTDPKAPRKPTEIKSSYVLKFKMKPGTALNRVVATRVPMPQHEIRDLPPENAWALFEKLYDEAIDKQFGPANNNP